jgi:hypothetical protein
VKKGQRDLKADMVSAIQARVGAEGDGVDRDALNSPQADTGIRLAKGRTYHLETASG